MGESTSPIIILDGHDGVGKTTIANTLTKTIGGKYVRPFEGSQGVSLISAADAGEYDKVLHIGKTAIMAKLPPLISEPLIFDRHWLTVLSLLPKSYRKCWSQPSNMHTFLCTASLETIKARISERKEEKFGNDYHEYYIQKYLDIAEECKISVLNTTSLTVIDLVKKILDQINFKFTAL